MEVTKNEHGWSKLVRIIEKIDERSTIDLDKVALDWDKFIEEYPKILQIPPFKPEEQILFRAFMIPNQNNDEPKITKKDYEVYLRFFSPEPNFHLFRELLDISYYFGFVSNERMTAAFQNSTNSFLIRQSANIPHFVISFKPANREFRSLPLTVDLMDPQNLLKFLKDKREIAKKINATLQGEKIKWASVDPRFRADSLVIAQQELQEYQQFLKNKHKPEQFYIATVSDQQGLDPMNQLKPEDLLNMEHIVSSNSKKTL